MNEMNMPVVDNNDVVPQDPAFTGTGEPKEITTPKPVDAPVADDAPAADEPVADEPVADDAPVEDTPVEDAPVEEPASDYDGARFKELLDAQKYQAEEVTLDFYDEYGNIDQAKFGEFLQQNNQKVFEQATQAAMAKVEAQQIEEKLWNDVYTNYGEIKDNPALETALRGARIQDMVAGGDGDLTRLAKEIVAPIRQNKIKAIEDVNRSITEQKKLETFTPDAATPAPAAVPLMTQLKQALDAGDSERAQTLRHAIRKERIYGKSDNVTT